jgi:Family of unknown function (DUF5995)
MSPSPLDQRLLALVTAPAPATVAEVRDLMRALDAMLPGADGLKWFNWLYLEVTARIGQEAAAQHWQDGGWLERLDVAFGNLYFQAIRSWLAEPQHCPRAWVPLFEARQRAGVDRLQFALAGMNAHINRDLAVAIVRVCEADGVGPDRTGPHHADYLRVNDVLDGVEAAAAQRLATGLLGEVAGLSRADDLLAMWKVREARNAAWTHAEVLWHLRGVSALFDQYLATMDRMAGFAGRGLLLAIPVSAG